MRQCENCGRRLVGPDGPTNAYYLLVGDAPTTFDVKDGKLWTGPGGDILKTEITRGGVHYQNCRVTNMWLHPKDNDCQSHLDDLLLEMATHRFILLMGADAVKYFTDENVSDVSGLRVDQIPYAQEMLPKGSIVYASFNPALALHDKMGEIRFAMEKFGAAAREV